jgi:hypothetical protein
MIVNRLCALKQYKEDIENNTQTIYEPIACNNCRLIASARQRFAAANSDDDDDDDENYEDDQEDIVSD